ncbi:hypothetical protein [Pararobbsia silviterrae]|uniref:hypothetical protein n=1 Tax=Pararobbsia silviterrae TaxID=1792498 RepID=UPI00197EB2F6|nr:hypothetical protein [Pararobbsia silviterrae]
MKPILRALLVVDGVLTLVLGLALVASPWANTIVALQAVAPKPPALGQLFGIALLGFAWLQWHAAYDGQLTVAVARVTGHVNWISGVVLLAWLIALHDPSVEASRAIVFSGPVIALVLLVIGVGLVRLADAIRRRARASADPSVFADEAEQRDRARIRERDREAASPVEPAFARGHRVAAEPVADASPSPSSSVSGQHGAHENDVRDPRVALPPDDIRRPL